MRLQCDVLIVGSGLAGLNTALSLDKNLNIVVLSNASLKRCNTYLAQGGITTILNEDDKELFIADTLKAGHYKNNLEVVKLVADEADGNMKKLINWGVPFTKDKEGNFKYTKEAAHSSNRIMYCDDSSGKKIWQTLAKEAEKRENIIVVEKTNLVDLKIFENQVCGIIAEHDMEKVEIDSKVTVLATGGIGGIFRSSTNYRNIKGIGIAMALRHNIKLKDINYIQLHPTAFYSEEDQRKFLLSESLRGEGAHIKNDEDRRFVDELLPRDIVTKEIMKEKTNHEIDYVFLDARHLGKDYLLKRFPKIYNYCLENGIDMSNEKVPISPSQHYFMGGIEVNLDTETSVENLFACGEVSCTGLHGKNRLASNSLLEALVFSTRTAKRINQIIDKKKLKVYNYEENDLDKVMKENKKLVVKEISKYREDLKNELLNS